MTISPFFSSTRSASYVAVNPESQSKPIEMSELVKDGKICAFLAISGKSGQFKLAICDDVTVDPSGNFTVIGVAAA